MMEPINDEYTPLLKSKLEIMIDQSFVAINAKDKKKKLIIQVGNLVFIFLMSSSVVPYYLIAGIEINTPHKVINQLSPACIVLMNIMQAAYAADEVFISILNDMDSGQPILKKRFKQFTAFFASVWQTLPYTIGAYYIGKSTLEKFILIPTITASGLSFYFFSSYLFLNSGLYPLMSQVKHYLAKKDSKSHAAFQLKNSLKHLLMDACKQLKISIPKSQRHYNKLFALETADERISWFLNKGNKWRASQNTLPSKYSYLFFPIKKLCASTMGIFSASSQVGYACSTEYFFKPFVKGSSWLVSSVIMTPITFFSGLLGFNGLATLFDNIKSIYNNKCADLPFALRAYPKTTLSLSLLMLFVSAFGWADDIETLEDTCPSFLKETLQNIIYFSAGTFNFLLLLQLIENLMVKYAKLKKGDNQISAQLIQLLEKQILIIDNCSDEEFFAMMTSPRSEHIKRFLSETQPEEYQQFEMSLM